MAERPKNKLFDSLRSALALPAPERGSAFWEYPHSGKEFARFRVRVHPPDLNGQVLRQWAIRAKYTLPGGGEKEDRRTFGQLQAFDKTQVAVSYKDGLQLALDRLRDIEKLKSSPAAADAAAAAALRMTVADAWARHEVETRTQRGSTTDKEVGIYGLYFAHLGEARLDALPYRFWSLFVQGLGVARRYDADGVTWTQLPSKRAEATVIGIINLASKLYEIAHRYEGLPGKDKNWNPARDAKKQQTGTPNKRTGSIPLPKLAEVWRAADVMCATWARDHFRLYVLTGLRHSLMAELQFSEVDAKARVLRISPHKKGTKRRGKDTAANAPAIILPLSATALGIIEARRAWAPDPEGPVWYSVVQPGGKPAKGGVPEVPRYSDPRSNWAHLERQVLGGVHFTRHDLRRTFANSAVDAQADLMGTSLLMMHSPRTLAAVLGLPDITVEYMNTAKAQRQMRSATDSIERYVLGLLDGSEIPSEVEPELPAELAASVGKEGEDEDD